MPAPEKREINRIREAILTLDPDAFIYKAPAGPMGYSGLPDLYVCTRGHHWWIEVKIHPNSPTPNQWACMDNLSRAGANVALVGVKETVKAKEWVMGITIVSEGDKEPQFYGERDGKWQPFIRLRGKKWDMSWLYTTAQEVE